VITCNRNGISRGKWGRFSFRRPSRRTRLPPLLAATSTHVPRYGSHHRRKLYKFPIFAFIPNEYFPYSIFVCVMGWVQPRVKNWPLHYLFYFSWPLHYSCWEKTACGIPSLVNHEEIEETKIFWAGNIRLIYERSCTQNVHHNWLGAGIHSEYYWTYWIYLLNWRHKYEMCHKRQKNKRVRNIRIEWENIKILYK
jgi:hypothetical protein